MLAQIRLKRVYAPVERGDGFRVLVDRLWPRGLAKKEAKIDWWCKEIAPSNELRSHFHQNKLTWAVFQKKYYSELRRQGSLLNQFCIRLSKYKRVTLLFGAKNELHNNAVALLKILLKK